MIDSIETELEKLYSAQKEKPEKTFVARYKGKNLKMRSGKSSWKQIGHAKAAVLFHFQRLESIYKYHPYGEYDSFGKRMGFVCDGMKEREQEFRDKLWELIEIVELK